MGDWVDLTSCVVGGLGGFMGFCMCVCVCVCDVWWWRGCAVMALVVVSWCFENNWSGLGDWFGLA